MQKHMQQRPFKTLQDMPALEGKTVLVRMSINVPITDGVVQNQFRVTRGLATLNALVAKGAKLVLLGHIGRSGEESTEPIASLINQFIPTTFIDAVTGSEVLNAIEQLAPGSALMLQNVRKDPREKANDPEFARQLAEVADYFVNDAFAASHRTHASIVGVAAHLPSFAGHNFTHEFDELQKTRTPNHPSLFMLGGAKFETKMPLVEQFLEVYDHVFIGGALANDCFKGKGLEVGKSLVSETDLSGHALLSHPNLLLPVDVVVERAGEQVVTAPDAVQPEDIIFDVGPDTVAMLEPLITNAASILWNGPFGNYEKGYDRQTLKTAELVASASGYAVIGGGDTVASIESLFCQEKIAFLSTAGGAMLYFLEFGTLPAIDALRDK